MKLTPHIFAVGLLFGSAHGSDRDMPRMPGYPSGQAGLGPPSTSWHPGAGGLRIDRRADEQGYYLRIHPGGMAPEAINVTPMGRSLVISTTRSVQTEHRQAPEEVSPGYRRWSYSTHRSSGAMQRRIAVPRDANMEAMQRTDNQGVILITLPRFRPPAPQGHYDVRKP